MERRKRHEKAHFKKAYSEKTQIKDKWKSPPKHRTGSIRNHGKDQGPEMNRPRDGGGQEGPPVVRPHPSVGASPMAATLSHLFQAVAWRHA